MSHVKTPPHVKTQKTSSIVNLETYTPDENLIISKAQGDKLYIGRVYEMSPLIGGGGEFGNVIVNLFKSVPDDSIIQVSLICAPDYEASNKFAQGKEFGHEIVRELIARQCKLLDSALQIGWQSNDVPPLNLRTIVISLAIPAPQTNKQNLAEATNLQTEFLTSLKGCGFRDAKPLSAGDVLGVYRQFADIFSPRRTVELDELLDLKVQAYGPDQRFDFRDSDVGLFAEDIFCTAVTAKLYPKKVSHGLMNLVSGAPMNSGTTLEGGGQRIGTPFIITTSIRVANQRKESDRIQKAIDSRTANQNFPFKLGNEDSAAVLTDLQYMQKMCASEGDKFVYATTTAFLFGRTQKQVLQARSSLKDTLDKLGFDGRPVRDNVMVRWAQALPMNFAPGIAEKLSCEAIMPVSSGACLLPIYGDNLGNADLNSPNTGAVFLTRRGCPHYFDAFRSQSNKNGVLCARSGAGKSFALQYLVNSDLAEGTHVILFDNGRSSKKYALAVDGEFNEFAENRVKPSLNPFTGLSDDEFNEQHENITSLLLLMAYEEGEIVEPGARIALSEAVKAAHGQKSSDADIPTVISSLVTIEKSGAENTMRNQVVVAASNLVPRLRAFIESPSRGQYFRGEGTLNPTKQLTVFELGGLMGDNHLRKCVLFFVMNTLMTRIKNIPGRKKIYVDEASDLLKDEGPAAVMDGLYRKGRKDNVSVWVITQSPRDLAGSPAGQVILSQSAWKLIMAQEAEEVDKIVKEGILTQFANDPYFNKLIKDVETKKGVYSEILILGNNTYEVVRLYVDRFTASLFSSEGEDRDGVFLLMDKGMSAIDAVCKVIGDNSRRRKAWITSFVDQLRNSDGLSETEILNEVREILKLK